MSQTQNTPPPSNVIPMPGLTRADAKKSKERWSPAVIERGYTIIPTILLWGQAKLELTPDELNVLLQLISHWWYAGNDPHPAKDKIAARMKKHPRTVQAYLSKLENRGFIRRVERYRTNKGQDSNAYDLSGLLAKLDVIAPDFKKAAEQNRIRQRKVEAPAAG